VGDYVFLKVKANKNSLKLGNCSMLAPIYCGSFEILERIGHVAYMLALTASMIIHNVFHLCHDENLSMARVNHNRRK
jgi:hypothetical protein